MAAIKSIAILAMFAAASVSSEVHVATGVQAFDDESTNAPTVNFGRSLQHVKGNRLSLKSKASSSSKAKGSGAGNKLVVSRRTGKSGSKNLLTVVHRKTTGRARCFKGACKGKVQSGLKAKSSQSARSHANSSKSARSYAKSSKSARSHAKSSKSARSHAKSRGHVKSAGAKTSKSRSQATARSNRPSGKKNSAKSGGKSKSGGKAKSGGKTFSKANSGPGRGSVHSSAKSTASGTHRSRKVNIQFKATGRKTKARTTAGNKAHGKSNKKPKGTVYRARGKVTVKGGGVAFASSKVRASG